MTPHIKLLRGCVISKWRESEGRRVGTWHVQYHPIPSVVGIPLGSIRSLRIPVRNRIYILKVRRVRNGWCQA